MVYLSDKLKRQLLFVMTALVLLTAAATDINISSLPQMVSDFHSTPATVNMTISVYNLGIAFGVLFVGEISNRFGRRKVSLYGVACFVIASFVIVFTPSIYAIIFLRLLQAFGTAVVMIVSRLILKDCMDERDQIRGNGILLIGLMISPAIAPILGAYLAKYFGWRSCFTFSGVVGLALLSYCWKILPETNVSPLPKFSNLTSYVTQYKNIMQSRMFWVLTIIYTAGFGTYFAFIGVSSYLYINHWHFAPTSYSYLYIGLAAAYFVGNTWMMHMNKQHKTPQQMIAVGIYSTMIGAIIMLIPTFFNQHLFLVFMVTIGVLFMRVANAIINPIVQVRLMNHFQQQGANALGLNISISFIAASFAIWLVTLFPVFPLASLVVVSLIFSLISVLIYISNVKQIMQ